MKKQGGKNHFLFLCWGYASSGSGQFLELHLLSFFHVLNLNKLNCLLNYPKSTLFQKRCWLNKTYHKNRLWFGQSKATRCKNILSLCHFGPMLSYHPAISTLCSLHLLWLVILSVTVFVGADVNHLRTPSPVIKLASISLRGGVRFVWFPAVFRLWSLAEPNCSRSTSTTANTTNSHYSYHHRLSNWLTDNW